MLQLLAGLVKELLRLSVALPFGMLQGTIFWLADRCMGVNLLALMEAWGKKTIDIDGVICEDHVDASGRRMIITPDGTSIAVGPTVPDRAIREMLSGLITQQSAQAPTTAERVELAGVTLTNSDGSKLKIKEGRGHVELEAFILDSGAALGVSWDGILKLELTEEHGGFRYVQAGEVRIEQAANERRPLRVRDNNDLELAEFVMGGTLSELKLIVGGQFDDIDTRQALTPFFPAA